MCNQAVCSRERGAVTDAKLLQQVSKDATAQASH